VEEESSTADPAPLVEQCDHLANITEDAWLLGIARGLGHALLQTPSTLVMICWL
jgi:hypothetical protein